MINTTQHGHSIGVNTSAMASASENDKNKGIKKEESVVIPVIQEQLTVSKELIDTAKVTVRKKVTEETASVNIPLAQEGYRVERVPVNKVVDTPPQVRHEGETMIIPVMREVLVVQKRYEIVEEVHLIKEKTVQQHHQEVVLKKEEVTVQRTPLKNDNQP